MLHTFTFWFEEDVIPLHNDIKNQEKWTNEKEFSVRKSIHNL